MNHANLLSRGTDLAGGGIEDSLNAGHGLHNFVKIGHGWEIGPVQAAVCRYDHLFMRVRPGIQPEEMGYSHKDAELLLLRYVDIPEDVLTNPESAARAQDDLIAKNLPPWPLFTSLHPLLYELMRRVQGTHIGGVGIVKLPPGGIIAPHVDMGRSVEYFQRYHIVISGPRDCWFTCGGEQVEQLTGEIWRFDASKEHAVRNESDETRISASIDISSR